MGKNLQDNYYDIFI